MKPWITVLFALAVIACGDDILPIFDATAADINALDGGADADRIAAPVAPALPEEPQCPDDWQQAGECVPPVEPPACPSRTFALPGDPVCTRVGDECPSGDFPPVVGPALYVRPGVSGDGSATRPFATIAEALSAAQSGTTIVLSEGEFSEGVYLPAGVGLVGSCSATVLRGDDDAESGALEFGGQGTFARNLTIRAEQQSGVISFGGEGLLDGVTIESAFDTAIYVDGGTVRMQNGRIERPGDHASVVLSGRLEMENVEITGATDPQLAFGGGEGAFRRVVLRESRLDDEGFSTGLFASGGAHVEVEDFTVLNATGSAITALDAGTEVRARRVHLRGTRRANMTSALGQGTGGYVGRDARIEIQGGVLEDNLWGAVQSTVGGMFEATDLWVRENRNGLTADNGGFVSVTRARIRGDVSGLVANGGEVQAVDVRIDGTGSSTQGNVALSADSGGRLNVTRLTVGDYTGYGLLNQGGHSRLEDATFEVVRGNLFPERLEANAMIIEDALSAELVRVRVDSIAGSGIIVLRSTMTMEDIDINETMWSQDTGARAIVLFGGNVEAERIRITAPRGWGIDMYNQAELMIRDYEVRSAGAGPFGWGVGLHVRDGSRADVLRAHIINAMGIAVWAQDEGSQIHAQELSVESIGARQCAMSSCESEPAGIGVGAYDGAEVTLSDFEIDNAVLCGVQVGPESSVDLSDGQVSDCAIGACVHSADYAVSRLTANVAYQDNELNIDTVSLPIPEAPEFVPTE